MARVNQLQSGIRHAPISPELATLLNSVGEEANVYFDVTSGGQNSTTGHTGSHRHDEGNAADVKAYTLGADGSKHYLDQSNPADNAIWKQIVQLSVAGGATGVGAGPDYMGNLTAHIGFGKPAVWGAGGHSANAPEWLKVAYNSGQHTPPGSIPQVGTALDTIDRVVPRPLPSGIASAYANTAPPLPPMPQPRPPRGAETLGAQAGSRSPGAMASTTTLGWDPTDLTHTTAGETVRGGYVPPASNAIARLTAGNVPPIPSNFGLPAPFVPPPVRSPTAQDTMLEQRQMRQMPVSPFVSEDHPRSKVAIGGPVAPVPMPGRPPDAIAAPPVPVQAQTRQLPPQVPRAPVAPPVQTVLTVSGQPIAVGIHDQGDHSVMVSDDGTGHAKIDRIRGPGAIPGLIDPLKEANANTVAGGMIRSMLPKMATDALSDFNAPSVGNNIKNSALDAASNLGASAQNFGSNIVSGLGSMFAQPKQVINPAYTRWQASQTPALKAGQAYTATGNIVSQAQQNAFGGLSSAPKSTPAPPKYITVTPHVPVPSAPARIPLSTLGTVNPGSQILPNIGSAFNTTPAGHLTQLLTGQPIQGGLLSLLFGGGNPLGGMAPQPAPVYPNSAGAGPVVGAKQGTSGYTIYNGNNGVPGNSGNWFNQVTGRA